ncbi:MAG: hypothetical protein MJE77_04560 [Proteobacteria bacterium]|nr:hypothetical protein [Pseudomonadota bacterium]
MKSKNRSFSPPGQIARTRLEVLILGIDVLWDGLMVVLHRGVGADYMCVCGCARM